MEDIHIQSFSDVITNSSSVIFVIRSDYKLKELEKMFSEHYDAHAWDRFFDTEEKIKKFEAMSQEKQARVNANYNRMSGMAMTFEFNDYENLKYLSNEHRKLYNEGKCQVVELDHSACATIKWLKETFDIIDQW